MKTTTDAESLREHSSAVFDSIKVQERLAPLLLRTPIGEKRMQLLRRLADDLESIKGDKNASLEFVGLLNAERFKRIFSKAPENISAAFRAITYETMTFDLGLQSDSIGLVNNNIYRWPEFSNTNKDRANDFVRKLLNHIDMLLASG